MRKNGEERREILEMISGELVVEMLE